MAIDFSSNIGKVRLRIGDTGDLPFLPDEVINNTLVDTGNSLPKAAQTCAQYILAMLAFKTHKKMVQLEIWGQEGFQNYRTFLLDTINNPAFMSYSPVPYGVQSEGDENPLVQFVNDWNNNWNENTVTQNMQITAWDSTNGLNV